MKIHIRHGNVHLVDLHTRLPFKYGIATMTATPHVFVRLAVEVKGKVTTGTSADHLPPKWFTKDPTRAIHDEALEMLDVIEHAVGLALDLRADSTFDAWLQVHQAQSEWGRREKLPPLLTQFGTSLVERALIDAVCRAHRQPFARLLRRGLLGMRIEAIHPELRLTPADCLPARPFDRCVVRHTVGLLDPLEDGDIGPGERLDDGLPQSLTACIRPYGLYHFKIKLSGNLESDRERLLRLAGVLDGNAPADYIFSLDGNEQFRAWSAFRAFWQALARTPKLERFLERLMFVEQPLHRDVALDAAVGDEMGTWPDRPPIIIDESDAELDSLRNALSLGYAGTSHKNCKGVFKGLANHALLVMESARGRECRFSGEDLANIGPVALLQDLAVCATLGIQSVERNGHHYFAGLSMFPPEVQRQVLAAHGDLYRASPQGWPTLAIRDGRIALGSINAAPFGVWPTVNVEAFVPAAVWRAAAQGA